MNIIYLGKGQTGVQQAANYYFGKDVSELSLVECAAIASIVKNPSQYNPESHEDDYYVTNSKGEEVKREGNASRRWVVLEEMYKNGYITEAECREAQNATLVLAEHDEEEESLGDGMTLYSWYTEALITDLTNALMEKYNIEYTVAINMVYNSGYKIYTPMDPEVQKLLEEIYTNDTAYFPSTGVGLQPQSACVVTDPATNDVLGVVGGRGQKTINRGTDRATVATRPPGSSIKPLSVYAPALDAGIITYGSVVDDTPVMFNKYVISEGTDSSSTVYGYDPYPQNLPVVYRGLTTINSAVTRSVNTVAMKVLQMLTIDKSFDFMKNKLGFDSLIESAEKSNGEVITDKGLAALALGQPNYGVTLLEMTAAYEIFDNNGIYNSPKLFIRVEDSEGNVVIDNSQAETNIVIKDETASIMTIMLQKVMNEGTGTGCTLRNYVDVAGKTGTTSSDFDRYFVGYTPYYVCGVWTGYDMNQSLSAFGENPSLTVWDTIMTKLHQKYIDEANNGGTPLKTFEVAPGVIEVTYCKDSGKLCTDACDLDPRGWRRETGYFTRETAPTEYCDTHVIVKRDNSTGLIASANCNPANCSDVALIRVEDRSFPIEIYVEDAQYVYREMPSSVKPGGWWGVPFFVNMLSEGEYCGSSYASTPYNAYCYKHCDYRPWGGNPPAEDSGYSGDSSTSTETTAETDEYNDTGQEETIPNEVDFSDETTSDDQYTDDFYFWDDWFE
jgi:penicillin-binding protein 1A